MGILKNLPKSVMQVLVFFFHNVVNTSKTMMQVSFISLQCCEHIKNPNASFNLFFDNVVNTWRTVKQTKYFFHNVLNTSKNLMHVSVFSSQRCEHIENHDASFSLLSECWEHIKKCDASLVSRSHNFCHWLQFICS